MFVCHRSTAMAKMATGNIMAMVMEKTKTPGPKRPSIWFYPKQKLLHEATTWVKGFVGGRGCGKTKLGAYEILCHAKNGDSWMVVSPSYVVLGETTWPA